VQGSHTIEPEKQPVAPSLREKRPDRVSKLCFWLWILAFLSVACGLIVPVLAEYSHPFQPPTGFSNSAQSPKGVIDSE
jgi:hypothetical protein